MTYIEIINRFWELDESWQFSCCETRLYFYLLKIANRLGWEDNWTRSDTKVSSDVGVSVKVFKSARNRLVQAGLIECKQGNGRGNKSTYSIKGVQKGSCLRFLCNMPYFQGISCCSYIMYTQNCRPILSRN